jgi:dTDP-4-amino-4,6-dideoxygalactose transaminase
VREYVESDCDFDPASRILVDIKSGKPIVAIVPVHLYGQMADMDPILALADQYNLIVIEDACQAQGAEYFSKKENRWRKAGSMGQSAAFSFYPGKNLGACGEAGAITTNDPEIARKVRVLRDHGQAQKYYHDVEGYNGRLDAIQAGLLQVKLRHLANWNEKRRQCAKRYQELFGSAEQAIRLPHEPSWSKSVYHLYVIRVENREELQKHLGKANIGTGIHYPIPLHLQKAYTSLGYKPGDFPVSEKVAGEIVSLPMFPGLGSDQQSRVAEEVLSFELSKVAMAVTSG